MPVNQEQLTTDLDFLRSTPGWQSGDETQRREMARQVAIESAASGQDPEQHQALVSKLWEQADPRGWLGKSADFVGSVVKEVAASAVASGPAMVFAATDAAGLSDTGSGMRLKRGVADLGNAAIQAVKQIAPNDHQEQLADTLDALREDIHNDAVPTGVKAWLAGDEPAAEDVETQQWIDHLTNGLGGMAAKADTRLQFNPGMRKDAVTAKSEQELRDAWLTSDRNPANVGVQQDGTQVGTRDFLADYLVTRDPASWQQFVNRVTENESQHKTRVARSLTGEQAAMKTAGEMGLQGDLIKRGLDMQTSPIDMATAALPVLRGMKLLKAVQGGAEAGSVARRVAMGAGEEALQEGVTQKLQDARATNADVLEAAAMGAIGSGAIEGTMAAGGRLFSGRPTASPAPGATGASSAGTNPAGPGSPPPPAGTTTGQTGGPSSAGSQGPATPGGTAPSSAQGNVSSAQGSMTVNAPRQFVDAKGEVIAMEGPTPRLAYESAVPTSPDAPRPLQAPRLALGAGTPEDQTLASSGQDTPTFASVNEGSQETAPPARIDSADATNKAVGEAQSDAGSTPATGANVEVDLFGNPIETPKESALKGVQTEEVPLNELRLSRDVPQFKAGADEAGVVEPLAGKYERMGTAPILVWERMNGQREVISGRHRFDLAKRTGERTIPAQVVREADGFSQKHALTADAEINIRDGQGQVRDYANYFRNAGIDAAEAESRGLLGRSKGRDGWAIGTQGGESLFDLHVNERLTDAQAVALAKAAPNDDGMQRVGIKAMLDEGASIDHATNLIRAVRSELGAAPAEAQMDLFGRDDSAMRDMTKMAKAATTIQRGLREQVAAVKGAVTKPEAARKMGLNVNDPAAIKARMQEIQATLDRWENWPLHDDLRAQVREVAGLAPKPAFGLESVTPEQLKAEQEQQRQRDAVRDRAAAPLQGTAGPMGTADMFDNTAGETPLFDQPMKRGEELSRTAQSSAFERAQLGDESAYDDMEAAFRARYGYGEPASNPQELSRTQGKVFTAQGFEQVFDEAWQSKDFDTFLEALKQSDRGVWAPLLKRFFQTQADNPENAAKAEWFRAAMGGTRPPGVAAQQQGAGSTGQGARTAAPPQPSSTTTRTSTSTPPPPKAKASPPPPPVVPPRIPVNPIRGGLPKSPFQIIEDFSRAIGKHIWVRRLKPKQLGVYRPGSTMTATRFAGDLDTTAHELAGHWVDDKHGIGKAWAKSATSPFDTELATFWAHGSPSNDMKIKRAEGIAEFFRAYVMDPQATMAQAPQFSAHVAKVLPADALKALNQFSDDVRTWAGADASRRAAMNIRMDPPSVKEKLRTALFGDGREFSKTWADKMAGWFSDEFHYATKGFETALKLAGKSIKNLKPSENFELMLRWLSGHDSRFSDQLENGLTPLKTTQTTNAQGKMEVQRVVDPVTGQPMNLAWLLEAFDNTSKAAQEQDMREASGLMVAERTMEKAQQIDAETTARLAALPANGSAKTRARIIAEAEQAKRKISGLGAGMMTDAQAAQETINAVNADPNKAKRLREAARRYRAWANANLEMLVESGRMTRAQVDEIKANNAQYVDMHRLSEEFDLASELARGKGGTLHLGTTKDVIKRFKGSTLEIDNVYASLLRQTEAMQKEAARNRVMQTFVQQLESARGLYEGDAVELDRIGSKAVSEDRNTVKVYRNGKAEFWKLDKDIHAALKGVGDMGSHFLIDLVSIPQSIARYVITRSPAFVARNALRDTLQRSVVSNSGAKPWDILNGYTAADKARLMAFGGGMFGHYGKDRFAWNRELKRGMAELRKDPRNILMTPVELWRSWDKLAESSEALGRIAEFRRAFDKAKKELGYTDDEAALYAANEARGLLDFAKMGSLMRQINKIIPFSNAALRGLARTASGVANDPFGFGLRWSLYVALPTIAVRMLAKQMGGDTEEEYQQLPAWQRDFFWNIKVGNYWLRIPKPHELGVMAGGVERALSRELGEKNSFDGYGGTVAKALLPVGDIPSALGPLKAPAEIIFNRDSFRDRDIVPIWERDLKLELRKGAQNSSMVGQAVGKLLGADPRFVDHYLGSYGGLGQGLVDFTKPERKLGESALKATGVVLPPISSQSKDYQWVVDWAKANGKLTDKHVKALRDLSSEVYKAKTPQEADGLAKLVRKQATAIRGQIQGR